MPWVNVARARSAPRTSHDFAIVPAIRLDTASALASHSQETVFVLEQFRQLEYPEIEAVPDGEYRPQWSVMIPTYNCANLLRETLASVLTQDQGPERMQIEVIDDASTRDDPEAVVRELGQGRVTFYRHAKNVGATANFNACLSRSRGHLIHILHGDDLVLPDFYTRMEKLLEQFPVAGSATCRYAFIDADGLWTRLSGLNQRIAGIYSDALATIASRNWASFAAVVLRRSLVEAVGGFHPSLIHAADWDLWKRAALYQPVAYDPTVMACYRMFEGNDTSRLVKTGANCLDIRRAIELSSYYLPQSEAAAWIREARHQTADYAKDLAVRMLFRGDHETFRNQLREAFVLDPASWWSRDHIKIRYWYVKQRIKRLLIKIKERTSKRRFSRTPAGSVPSANSSLLRPG